MRPETDCELARLAKIMDAQLLMQVLIDKRFRNPHGKLRKPGCNADVFIHRLYKVWLEIEELKK